MSEFTPAQSDLTEISSVTDTPNDNGEAPAQATSTSSPQLNPRSCVTCRRRKVRCNKTNPCLNCSKAGIDCIFPGPGRAKRKSRKPPDAELLARLKKLEGVIESLGAHVDSDPPSESQPSVVANIQSQLEERRWQSSLNNGGVSDSPVNSTVDKQLGRLVISDGRSRYVSNAFWKHMGDEIAEMRDILDAPSSEDDEELDSPDHVDPGSTPSGHHGFLFSYSSITLSLRSYHPSPSQIFNLWIVFEENVDPVVRILHRPTTKKILIKASESTDNLSKAEEALIFVVYFAAVCSLSPAECQDQLGESKKTLSGRFRFAVEQALSRANLLNTSSLMILQAFVLFLISLRVLDETRVVWSLMSLACHLARALGIHRDGATFGVSPYETEMRRRLWWHICMLEARLAEDHGSDPLLTEAAYDTQLPLNLNDEDISPETKETPKERLGTTEMTFCLIRFELSAVSRRLTDAYPGRTPCGREAVDLSVADKERIIEQANQQMEERYLKYCDMSIPIYWVSATVGRLILAKLWLMIHHPLQYSPDGSSALSQDMRDRLFVTSVQVIEFANLLETNENTKKWSWLFRTYMQWHAVAFVLSELCRRPPGRAYDRAWRAVESVYDYRLMTRSKNQRGMLWRPMRQLMVRAKSVQARYEHPGGQDSACNSVGARQAYFGGSAEPDETGRVLFPRGSSIAGHLATFGLSNADLDLSRMDAVPTGIPSTSGMPQQQQQLEFTAPPSNFKCEEVEQWANREQEVEAMGGIQADQFHWGGWNLGTVELGDFPMANQGMGGTQQWF